MSISLNKDQLDSFFALPVDQFYESRAVGRKAKSTKNVSMKTIKANCFEEGDHDLQTDNISTDNEDAHSSHSMFKENCFVEILRMDTVLNEGWQAAIIAERKKIITNFVRDLKEGPQARGNFGLNQGIKISNMIKFSKNKVTFCEN